MKMITIRFLFFLFLVSSCKPDNNLHQRTAIEIGQKFPTDNKSNDTNNIIKEINDTANLLPIINKLPFINVNEFDLFKDFDDSLCNELYRLEDYQVDLLFSTPELIEYYDYFNFQSYFWGRMKTYGNYVPIIIINTNWETTIYLDFFLVDASGHPMHMFRPAYLELQPSYSFIGRGEFLNDSTYKLIDLNLETIDLENSLESIDSTIITYIIQLDGNIIVDSVNLGIDTISFYIIK